MVTDLRPWNETVVMTLLTPGPLRWKSWIGDLSETSNRYVPAFSDVILLPPLVSEMVKPGPTEPFTTFGAAPADALSTRVAAATRERRARMSPLLGCIARNATERF